MIKNYIRSVGIVYSMCPSGGMVDTLDLKSNPIKGIGSSPMMGTKKSIILD
ncbi:MAG: hypothetical protein ACXWFC_11790 [Nitrososphaeraceae archaeon]